MNLIAIGEEKSTNAAFNDLFLNLSVMVGPSHILENLENSIIIFKF